MSDYYDQLQHVLDYIEVHLKEEMAVDELAELCHYSTNHFNRIFQSVIGIPVKDYIRKRKLSVAAGEIINTNNSILNIALTYGFNSNESFSRAFKRIFDITPMVYRKMNTHAIPADFWKVSFVNSDLQRRYMTAVETLINRIKMDNNVLAVIVMGSLSYDKVWEKSDIDMTILVNDSCKLDASMCLLEDDIYVNGNIYTRSEFKNFSAKVNQSSVANSYYSLGTMVYCKDESLRTYFDEMCKLGEKDRDYAYICQFSVTLNALYKAEKWLKVKSDPRYSYIWILDVLKGVASMEVMMNNNIPNREVIQQALKYNNPIIESLYIKLMDERKNSVNLSQSIDMIYDYLRAHKSILCKVLLDYFEGTLEPKPLSVIVKDFGNRMWFHDICEVCEWLCDEGVLEKDISKAYITKKSNTVVYEPAYVLSGDDVDLII